MNLNLKNLSKLGFKGTGMFGGGGLLYRVKANTVEFASAYTPNMLGRFVLTPRQMKSFHAGKLSLVPEGFCNPSSRSYLTEHTTLHRGPVKSCAQIERVFSGESA